MAAFPYASQRMPVLAKNVVATSQPLATSAGLSVLLKGGNAVDAAIAAAAALTVVEPTSNGLGSDAFALIHEPKNGALLGFNGSGRSPANLDADRFLGQDKMPVTGWDAVTVPGCVDTWASVHQRLGQLPFEELMQPGIRLAEEGFAVSPITGQAWQRAAERLADQPGFRDTFMPKGNAPQLGETVRLKGHALALRSIAESYGESFYRGDIAEALAAFATQTGGLLTKQDLSEHKGEWVKPISVQFGGQNELFEIPPNGQGIASLIALRILDQIGGFDKPLDSADSVHLQLEAMKAAFAELFSHVGDPSYMDHPAEQLLSDEVIRKHADRIQLNAVNEHRTSLPTDHGTVYLCAADQDGMMVSFIQSNYMGFGSGVVEPSFGISLQNRGAGFSTIPGHPNAVGPGKRPFHTIIPGFLYFNGKPFSAFGVMGGHMQTQGHVQMALRMLVHGQNPQTASDAPRWYVHENGAVSLESGFNEAVAKELESRGHRIRREEGSGLFGGAQLVARNPYGKGYVAASDSRKDGHAAGF